MGIGFVLGFCILFVQFCFLNSIVGSQYTKVEYTKEDSNILQWLDNAAYTLYNYFLSLLLSATTTYCPINFLIIAVNQGSQTYFF
mgnify:CR=1 FL=1